MSRSNDIAGLTTSILDGVTAAEVGLGNVTNESKATMFTSPTFTGTTNVSSGVTLPSNPTIALGSNATFPTGHVLQVKNKSMGDRLSFTPSPQTWTDIAGLSVQITPASSSNKIMVFATVQGNSAQNVVCFLRTYRTRTGESTETGVAAASSARNRICGALKEISAYDIQGTSWNFIDSPSTDLELTYKVQVYANSAVVINSGTTTADNWSVGVSVSTITVMEIKQ